MSAPNAYADTPDANVKALAVIEGFADNICRDVATNGQSESKKFSGGADIGLGALTKKVTDLGEKTAGEYNNST